MNLNTITPYLSIFAPVAGLIVIMDYVIRDEYKSRIRDKLIHLAQVGTRPWTLAFYGLVVLLSFFFSILIVSVNGTIETIEEHQNSIFPALKSTGSFLIAIFLKILIWDYLMAYKSFLLWNSLRSNKKNYVEFTEKIFVLGFDLYFTAILTAAFLNWFDLIHMKNASVETASVVKALTDFFNSIDLVLKASIAKSFYILNGSLIFYLAAAICSLTKGAVPMMDMERIKEHVFKIIAAIVSIILLIILFCYKLAN